MTSLRSADRCMLYRSSGSSSSSIVPHYATLCIQLVGDTSIRVIIITCLDIALRWNSSAIEQTEKELGELNDAISSYYIDDARRYRLTSSTRIGVKRERERRKKKTRTIECPMSDDGMERFACPTADEMGRYRCIDDHVLCDGFLDCPGSEDEDRHACLFYKTPMPSCAGREAVKRETCTPKTFYIERRHHTSSYCTVNNRQQQQQHHRTLLQQLHQQQQQLRSQRVQRIIVFVIIASFYVLPRVDTRITIVPGTRCFRLYIVKQGLRCKKSRFFTSNSLKNKYISNMPPSLSYSILSALRRIEQTNRT
ncbi:unnamed protein product, partial [Trichogramma brassicae]